MIGTAQAPELRNTNTVDIKYEYFLRTVEYTIEEAIISSYHYNDIK